MKKNKNIITITNHFDGNKSKEVVNFSDQNVKNALHELTHIPYAYLNCMIADKTGSTYKVGEHYILQNKDQYTKSYPGQKNDVLIEVMYSTLY